MHPRLVEAAQAELNNWYPQFGSVVPPLGTGATHAWRGRIQPFPDGTEFASVMAHLQAGDTVRMDLDGVLAHPLWCSKKHDFFLPFSTSLTKSFEIVLVTFDGQRHPRVYCVSPEISRRTSHSHPHLRDDQGAVIDGKPLAALCIYLASDAVLPRDEMELVTTLDFTSMFLAKHLTWAATSRLTRNSIARGPKTIVENADVSRLLLRGCAFDGTHPWFAAHYRTDAVVKNPEDEINEWLRRGYWDILWPACWVGPVAPHALAEVYQHVRADAECHCGSGIPYARCHRAQDQRVLMPRRVS